MRCLLPGFTHETCEKCCSTCRIKWRVESCYDFAFRVDHAYLGTVLHNIAIVVLGFLVQAKKTIQPFHKDFDLGGGGPVTPAKEESK